MSQNQPPANTEARRLEQLWAGEFGAAYVERNRHAAAARRPFWSDLLREFPVHNVLEAGCNLGANLVWLTAEVPPGAVSGVDINLMALAELRRTLPAVNAIGGMVRELPFRDRCFDLVFTMGVLIHQPEATLPAVMAEIVRCSRRYVLCGEYFAETTMEIAYRGQTGALFKRNYGRLYQESFPELQLRKQGFLTREQGWDDVTWWLFEKV